MGIFLAHLWVIYKKSSLVSFELDMEEYEFYGALFVKTKWYMIIEYKQQSILETQILEFPDISDNSSFQQGPGREFSFLGYLYFYAVWLAFQILKCIGMYYKNRLEKPS